MHIFFDDREAFTDVIATTFPQFVTLQYLVFFHRHLTFYFFFLSLKLFRFAFLCLYLQVVLLFLIFLAVIIHPANSIPNRGRRVVRHPPPPHGPPYTNTHIAFRACHLPGSFHCDTHTHTHTHTLSFVFL